MNDSPHLLPPTSRRVFLRRGAVWIAAASGACIAPRRSSASGDEPREGKREAHPQDDGESLSPLEAETAPETLPRRIAKVGIVTDLHSADKAPAGSRHYRDAIPKLEEALADFKKESVDFRIALGDMVDRAPEVATELEWLDAVEAVYRKAPGPRHYVLGNHCVDTLTKDEFLEHTGAERTYYSFDAGGVHFVVLDACFRADGKPYGRNCAEWTDTDIPEAERKWLEADLDETRLPVIVFVHQRVDLDPKNDYTVRSAVEVRKILEHSERVLAVFQGHHHRNDLQIVGGVPYITLPAVVEGPREKNAWAILSVFADGSLAIEGRGDTKSRERGELLASRSRAE